MLPTLPKSRPNVDRRGPKPSGERLLFAVQTWPAPFMLVWQEGSSVP